MGRTARPTRLGRWAWRRRSSVCLLCWPALPQTDVPGKASNSVLLNALTTTWSRTRRQSNWGSSMSQEQASRGASSDVIRRTAMQTFSGGGSQAQASGLRSSSTGAHSSIG